MDELIKAFSIERIGKAGTKFDILKAQWFNQQYLRAKPDEELADISGFIGEMKILIAPKRKLKIVSIMKERVTFPKDFWEQGKFFFYAPTTFDEAVARKKWNDDAVKVLTAYKSALAKLSAFDAVTAKSTLEKVTASRVLGPEKFCRHCGFLLPEPGRARSDDGYGNYRKR